MFHMISGSLRKGVPVPGYRRFQDHGRLAPEGLQYVSSWVTSDMTTCYQLMECDDRRLLEQWMMRWNILIDFEVIPVITSAQAVEHVVTRCYQ